MQGNLRTSCRRFQVFAVKEACTITVRTCAACNLGESSGLPCARIVHQGHLYQAHRHRCIIAANPVAEGWCAAVQVKGFARENASMRERMHSILEEQKKKTLEVVRAAECARAQMLCEKAAAEHDLVQVCTPFLAVLSGLWCCG